MFVYLPRVFSSQECGQKRPKDPIQTQCTSCTTSDDCRTHKRSEHRRYLWTSQPGPPQTPGNGQTEPQKPLHFEGSCRPSTPCSTHPNTEVSTSPRSCTDRTGWPAAAEHCPGTAGAAPGSAPSTGTRPARHSSSSTPRSRSLSRLLQAGTETAAACPAAPGGDGSRAPAPRSGPLARPCPVPHRRHLQRDDRGTAGAANV